MTYSLGTTSRANLQGVHPDLVRVVERAIQITDQDFAVTDGTRTIAEQRENVRKGVSKTMASKHIVQADGFGRAVDLTPWVNGKPRWEWPPIYHIAAAVRKAAAELGVELVWGGAWNRHLSTIEGDWRAFEHAESVYRAQGHSFVDGPHYELAARPSNTPAAKAA